MLCGVACIYFKFEETKLKTQFKIGMKVDDEDFGVGVVHIIDGDYPVVTFQRADGSDYHFHFCDADIEYLKEYKGEEE